MKQISKSDKTKVEYKGQLVNSRTVSNAMTTKTGKPKTE